MIAGGAQQMAPAAPCGKLASPSQACGARLRGIRTQVGGDRDRRLLAGREAMPNSAPASSSHSTKASAKLRSTQSSNAVRPEPMQHDVDVMDHRLRHAVDRECRRVEVDRDAIRKHVGRRFALQPKDDATVREVGDCGVGGGQRRFESLPRGRRRRLRSETGRVRLRARSNPSPRLEAFPTRGASHAQELGDHALGRVRAVSGQAATCRIAPGRRSIG